MGKVMWRVWGISTSLYVIANQAGEGGGEAPWWRTGVSRVRPFWALWIAGSRGADGCEFDLEVNRECSPRVERLEMMGLAEVPGRIVRL